jgi:hypothetical protein
MDWPVRQFLGDVSDFAQDHLVSPTAPTPEPSSVLPVGTAVLALG